jgi:hypothetical protein
LAVSDDKQRVTAATLDELEEAIELLKVAYERYFNGVDRVPPTRDHDDVKRAVRVMMTQRIGTTALRFRMQGLKARLVTYEQYWTRILLQIEKGTFKRILAVSSRRELELRRAPREGEGEAPQGEAPQGEAPQGEAPQGEAPPKVEPPSATQRSRDDDAIPRRREVARAPSPPTRSGLPDGVDAGEVRELFKQFVAAKKALGESTAGLTYAKLLDKVSRELPGLRDKHGADIRFEVATEGGKVRLRARSRKDAGQKAS